MWEQGLVLIQKRNVDEENGQSLASVLTGYSKAENSAATEIHMC